MPVPTPHISAKEGDFAPTVLMPGDPLRSKFIAENYLENVKLINDVRGIQGYTGLYNGRRVSVMASGMGMPSMGIYAYELFAYYGVERIIRIGSCGALNDKLQLKDLVLAMGTCTDGNFADQYALPGTFCPIADFDLLRRASTECEKRGIRHHVGNVVTSNVFYNESGTTLDWAKMNVLAVEMEAAALYCTAARFGKQALCICSVTDSCLHPEIQLESEERRASLTQMIDVALAIAE